MQRNQYSDFIDVSSAFFKLQPPKDEGNEYFFQDLHSTAKGNHLVAETVMKHLEVILQPRQPEAIQ